MAEEEEAENLITALPHPPTAHASWVGQRELMIYVYHKCSPASWLGQLFLPP